MLHIRNNNFRLQGKRLSLLLMLILCAAAIPSCGSIQTEHNKAADETQDAGGVNGESNTEAADDLDMRMGGRNYVKEELCEDEIGDVITDSSYRGKILKIIEGEKGYQEKHKNLVQAVQDIVTDQNSELYGEDQVYVSTLPVFFWDCIENKVIYHNAQLLILSKDLKKMGICDIFGEGADVYSAYAARNVGPIMKEALLKRPKQKFIALANGKAEMLVTEKNKLLCSYPEISLKGKYYDALQDSEISVSRETLTESKNLVKLDITQDTQP